MYEISIEFTGSTEQVRARPEHTNIYLLSHSRSACITNSWPSDTFVCFIRPSRPACSNL